MKKTRTVCLFALLLSLYGVGSNSFQYWAIGEHLDDFERSLESSRATDAKADKLVEEFYRSQPNAERILEMRSSYTQTISNAFDAIKGNLSIRKKDAARSALLFGALLILLGRLYLSLRLEQPHAR